MPSFPAALAAWGKRKKITIPASKIDADLTGFPVAIDLDDSDIQAAIQADGADLRLTDSGGTLVPFELRSAGNILSFDGLWTWFNMPVAYYDATGDALYVLVKPIGSDLANHVVKYDFATNTMTFGSPARVNTGASNDDHDNGSINMRSDGKLVAFLPTHNTNQTTLEYRISTSVRDITAWDAVKTIGTYTTRGVSYAQSWRLSAENSGQKWFVFTRDDVETWMYTTSTDDMDTTAAIAPFWDPSTTTPYMMSISNGVDRMDFVLSPKASNSGNTLLYHIYYDGDWRNSDGALINGGAIPAAGFAPADFNSSSTVIDVGPSDTVWCIGIDYNSAGDIVILASVNPSDVPGNVEYHWCERNTGVSPESWSTEKITDGGQVSITNSPHYTAGCCIDTDAAKAVVLGAGDENSSEMQRWADTGSGWAKTDDLTAGTDGPNLRPFVPLHHPGGSKGGRFLWCSGGFYTHWQLIATNSHTGIRAYPAMDAQVKACRVKADLTSGSDTELYVYYDNPAAADGQDLANVYDNKALIIDLGDGLNKDTRSLRDNIDTDAFEITGYIDNSQGVIDSEQWMPQVASNLYDAGNWRAEMDPPKDLTDLAGLTVECFINHDSTGSNEHTILGNLESNRASLLLRVEPSSPADTVEFFVVANNGTKSPTTATGTIPADTDGYIGATYDGNEGGNTRCYVQVDDNTRTQVHASAGVSTMHGTAATIALGLFRYGENADYFKGAIGELRVWGETKSQAWCNATYRNFKDAAFLSFGTEELNTGEDAAFVAGADMGSALQGARSFDSGLTAVADFSAAYGAIGDVGGSLVASASFASVLTAISSAAAALAAAIGAGESWANDAITDQAFTSGVTNLATVRNGADVAAVVSAPVSATAAFVGEETIIGALTAGTVAGAAFADAVVAAAELSATVNAADLAAAVTQALAQLSGSTEFTEAMTATTSVTTVGHQVFATIRITPSLRGKITIN